MLTKRLSHLNDSISRKVTSRNEYDKTIGETEAAYLKILESSQTLLTVLKRETVTLTKKQARAPPWPRRSRTDEPPPPDRPQQCKAPPQPLSVPRTALARGDSPE